MKKLRLHNASFRSLEQGFRAWLDIQGYGPTTVYNLPHHLREFLHYLEGQGVDQITPSDAQHFHAHYRQLKARAHQRRGGGLSSGHLNKHLGALRKFADYLRKVGKIPLPSLPLGYETDTPTAAFLTESEIGHLFAVTYLPVIPKERINVRQQEALQSRDRAMLAVFYGCGLRRNEGVRLDVSDLDFDNGLVHVRHGKRYKERMVPMGTASLEHLQAYLYDHRPVLVSGPADALFVSVSGRRLGGQSLLLRLKRLQEKTEDAALQQKTIGLHTLRHSIATHLLAAGMKLDSIRRFLGHDSLESTQVYTHLAGLIDERPPEGTLLPNDAIHQTPKL